MKGDEMDVNTDEVVQVIGDAAVAVNSNTAADTTSDEVERAEKESGLPPETLRAIEEQTTPALLRQARRYAQRRVKRLRESGITVSPKTGAELVAEAFLDTWSGLRIWDPEKCSFSMHLQAVIKKRVYRQTRRADRFPMLLLPSRESANDQTLSDAERALRETRRQCCPVQLSETAATVCQDLLRLIAHDDEAIAILRCWEDGIVEPVAIIERVGFANAKVYRRARVDGGKKTTRFDRRVLTWSSSRNAASRPTSRPKRLMETPIYDGVFELKRRQQSPGIDERCPEDRRRARADCGGAVVKLVTRGVA